MILMEPASSSHPSTSSTYGAEPPVNRESHQPTEIFHSTCAQRTAEGWIASDDGAAFVVRVLQLPQQSPSASTATNPPQASNSVRVTGDWTLRIHLDGQRVEYLCTRGAGFGFATRELSAGGIRRQSETGDGMSFMPFVFRSVSATEGDPVDGSAQTSTGNGGRGKLGTIRLEISLVSVLERHVGPVGPTGKLNQEDVERTARMVASNSSTDQGNPAVAPHAIGLGAARPAPAWHLRTYSVEPREPLDAGPWVVFEFNYRPRGTAEAGIHPQTDGLKYTARPQQPTTSGKRAYDGSSPDDPRVETSRDAELHHDQPRLDDEEQEIAELKARLKSLEDRRTQREMAT
ncbi:hypothetical protein BKA62DRAFT_720373 [Auriculariales sp. MPI-PUGE-AT-0066]|nr:hypothetical protein BKA62DRAFT_720373 [Auriculariales sp. MPI-PUGE-AT-0066]